MLPALCDGPNEASGAAHLFVAQFWLPGKLHLFGAFAKVRKVTSSFVMSVRLHGKTLLSPDGFS